MPLTQVSTWRAPARTAARLFATARPRSLWQCTEIVARGGLPTFARMPLLEALDVLPLVARRIHRAELDVLDVALGARDHRPRHLEHGLAVLGELVHEVDVGRREEDVDARRRGVPDRLVARVDVALDGARQAGDARPAHFFGHRLHSLEVARRAGGKARLDYVDTEPLQLVGDLDFVVDVEGDAGRLLAVAQARLEYQYLSR